MSHAKSGFGELRSSWQRWTLAALIALTLLFGFCGNWIYEKEHGHRPDPFTVFYHTCQLLLAHGVHLPGDVHPLLHAGRLLGLLTLFTAGLMAFATFCRSEMLRLWLPFRRNHVVICGLGDLGLRLALDARRRGKFVVAIEKHGAEAAVERANDAGVFVLEGDACDAAMLRRVRLERAEFIVAACQNDDTNVAIATLAGQVLPANLERKPPLVCRLLLRDPELRRLLDGVLPGGLAAGKGSQQRPYTVNLGDLNLQATAARQALRRHPLDFRPLTKDNDTTVHLAVVGFGSMGRHLARQAAQIAHFAPGRTTATRKLRITVFDRAAAAIAAAFRERFPAFDRICELRASDVDPTTPALIAALVDVAEQARAEGALATFAVCLEAGPAANDAENLRLALDLSGRTKDFPVQTLIYQSSRCGFAAMFPAEARGAGRGSPLYAFGMIEDIYSWDVLLHESEDRLARTVHQVYAKHRRKEKKEEPDWETLPDNLKESNRHAADHIAIKLRALGYHQAPLQTGRPRIEQFEPGEMETLAQMEHSRWCAERLLDGWKEGPETIREKKINKNLKDWALLDPTEQKKDYEQIQAIPLVLEGVGQGVYR